MRPERIGRYRIVEELGRGGFATVYLGEDRGLDDLVAIKVLAGTQASDPDSVARFVAEARVMRNLRAPGVVTVHDVGEHDGRPYFVMEYCPRGTLADRLTELNQPLTVEEGVGLAEAIRSAMAGLHAASPPVVHRDVKPANLLIRHRSGHDGPAVGRLLESGEELIVGDFGLAKVVDLQATKLSLIAYSRGFASPEQIRGDGTIEPSADVYSASAVVAAALSGEAPEQVFAPGERAFSDEALARTGPLRAELERGMRYEREHRHPTVSQWARALTEAGSAVSTAHEVTNVVSPPPLPAPPPSPLSVAAPSTAGALAPADDSPPGAAPPGPPTTGASPVEPAPRRRRLLPLLAIGMVTALVLLGIAGLAIATLVDGGPAIIGPSEAVVGQEVAFAVTDGEVETWQIGDNRSSGAVLTLTPTSTGNVSVEVETTAGDAELTVRVRQSDSTVQIVGPAHIALGQVTTLSADGADAAGLTWTVGGETFQMPTLDIRPNEAGTLNVELETEDGTRVSRTFTIS